MKYMWHAGAMHAIMAMTICGVLPTAWACRTAQLLFTNHTVNSFPLYADSAGAAAALQCDEIVRVSGGELDAQMAVPMVLLRSGGRGHVFWATLPQARHWVRTKGARLEGPTCAPREALHLLDVTFDYDVYVRVLGAPLSWHASWAARSVAAGVVSAGPGTRGGLGYSTLMDLVEGSDRADSEPGGGVQLADTRLLLALGWSCVHPVGICGLAWDAVRHFGQRAASFWVACGVAVVCGLAAVRAWRTRKPGRRQPPPAALFRVVVPESIATRWHLAPVSLSYHAPVSLSYRAPPFLLYQARGGGGGGRHVDAEERGRQLLDHTRIQTVDALQSPVEHARDADAHDRARDTGGR